MKNRTPNVPTALALFLILNFQPLVAPAAPIVTAVAAGLQHTLFIKSDGSLWAMGRNSEGQLGDGTGIDRHVPIMIEPSNVVAVAAGDNHSLFVTSDGNLWGMGLNGNGQLGIGIINDQFSPVQITFGGGVTAVAGGGDFSLFIETNALWGTGHNDSGQLGNSTNADFKTPILIISNGVSKVDAAGSFTAYEATNGSLWTMGDDQYGQLGDGTNITRANPLEIVTNHSILTGVTALSAGGGHLLYLYQNTNNIVSLWGSGDNLVGDLGDGTTNTHYSPIEIVSSNVTAISAGNHFSLFIKSDGSLWAMGADNYGQLGDGHSGQLNYTNALEKVVSANATSVAGGGGHSLFIKSDGSLWGMGLNNRGQLGDGSTNNSVLPELIVPPPLFVVTNVALSAGTNLVFSGLNGFGSGSMVVLSSTNLTTPLNQWTPIWTNNLGSNGFSFILTNAINRTYPQRLYRLELF